MSETNKSPNEDTGKTGNTVCGLIILGGLFFPFGLAFIALCRWLWPLAFPQ